MMKLKEVLQGKGQVRIKEYEQIGDSLYIIGGAFYDGKRIVPIDGGFYPMEMKLEAYEWENETTLMIVR